MNLITDTASQYIIVLICAGSDVTTSLPAWNPNNTNSTRLCRCDETECLQQHTKSKEAMREYVVKYWAEGVSVGYKPWTALVEGVATFDNLRVSVARRNLQLMFMHLPSLSPDILKKDVMVLSNSFSVTPGAVRAIKFIRDPGREGPGAVCPRCPAGVYLSGNTLPVQVQLLDAFENSISFCRPEQACDNLPDATLDVQLFDGTTSRAQAVLRGQLTQRGSDGVIAFSDLSIEVVGSSYALRLSIIDKLPNTVFMQVDSSIFTVLPNAPKTLTVVKMSQSSGEFERLSVQPSLEVSDTFGKKVDCNQTFTPPQQR
jgi:hypothetical protein